ncbi:hypothetical protein FNV43_RR26743 [Rhamnella rubrinervis]|uniref:Uncharacterized protein n=1 Tax=Rhamnella rubrinervis TaxID=2594499 RepID=A0A8K0DPW9_9ROSA|nr:hypothetical protein FNV43_RR26743 [Rhamnella rubrinervis]
MAAVMKLMKRLEVVGGWGSRKLLEPVGKVRGRGKWWEGMGKLLEEAWGDAKVRESCGRPMGSKRRVELWETREVGSCEAVGSCPRMSSRMLSRMASRKLLESPGKCRRRRRSYEGGREVVSRIVPEDMARTRP